MLDFIGTVVTATMTVFVVTSVIAFLEVPRAAKLVLALCIGIWIGLAAAAGAAGWLGVNKPFPIIGIFVASPLAAAAIASASPAVRRAMLGLPVRLIIGLNIGRVLGFLFFLLAAQGRLAGPFPIFAGAGDIITGLAAISLLAFVQNSATSYANALAAWNAFGAADLVLAITLGVTSGEGSPLQIFHSAPGSAAVQQLPWSFIPTVLVPLWLILHATVWVQLRAHRRMSAGQRNGIAARSA
jgi:hypothetical protein